jgi:hypothetical protein
MFPYVVYKLKRNPRRETDQEKRTKKFIKKPCKKCLPDKGWGKGNAGSRKSTAK